VVPGVLLDAVLLDAVLLDAVLLDAVLLGAREITFANDRDGLPLEIWGQTGRAPFFPRKYGNMGTDGTFTFFPPS